MGVSPDFFDEHVRQELRVVRRGRLVFVSVIELDRWLEQTVHDLKRSSAVRYRQLVDFHVSPRIGHVKLNQLSPADINRILSSTS